jgi:hypothetical protein
MPGDMQSIRPLSPLMVYEHPENEWKSLGVVSLTVQTPTSSSFAPRETQPPPPPSRWRTPEFLFYGVAFLIVVPYMVKVPYDISNGEFGFEPGCVVYRPHFVRVQSKLLQDITTLKGRLAIWPSCSES